MPETTSSQPEMVPVSEGAPAPASSGEPTPLPQPGPVGQSNPATETPLGGEGVDLGATDDNEEFVPMDDLDNEAIEFAASEHMPPATESESGKSKDEPPTAKVIDISPVVEPTPPTFKEAAKQTSEQAESQARSKEREQAALAALPDEDPVLPGAENLPEHVKAGQPTLNPSSLDRRTHFLSVLHSLQGTEYAGSVNLQASLEALRALSPNATWAEVAQKCGVADPVIRNAIITEARASHEESASEYQRQMQDIQAFQGHARQHYSAQIKAHCEFLDAMPELAALPAELRQTMVPALVNSAYEMSKAKGMSRNKAVRAISEFIAQIRGVQSEAAQPASHAKVDPVQAHKQAVQTTARESRPAAKTLRTPPMDPTSPRFKTSCVERLRELRQARGV